MKAAASVYARNGRPLFMRVSGEKSPLMTVTAAEFAAGNYDFLGFKSTTVRMALALARLRRSEGLTEESMAFATYGLEKIGHATGLHAEFKELLQK